MRFEQRFTPDGQVFYVDHHLKITSWELFVPFPHARACSLEQTTDITSLRRSNCRHKPRRQTLRRKVKYVREQVLARVRADGRGGSSRDRPCLLRVRRDDLFESSFEEIARKVSPSLSTFFVVRVGLS